MNKTLQIANSGFVWMMCAIVMIAVLIQAGIFAARGWKEARKLDVSTATLKKTAVSSAIVSVIPTMPVIIVLFVMIPVIGTPLSWLRLSTIGSGALELIAATMGAEAVGEAFTTADLTSMGFFAAMWVGCLSGAICSFVATTILRPISAAYAKISEKSVTLIGIIGSCSLAGVVASMNVSYSMKDVNTILIALAGFIVAVLLRILAVKFPKMKVLSDFNLPLGLIAGMFVAALLG